MSSSSPTPILSDPSAIRDLLVQSGMFGIAFLLNTSLVYVTWRDKSLRSRCNRLIAFEAAFGAIFQLNSFLTLAIALSGAGTVSLRLCCLLIQPIPTLAFWCYLTMMLMVALDRLSSIIFPIWYFQLTRGNSSIFYHILTLGTCLLASAYHFQGKFRWVMEEAQTNLRVVCFLNDCNGAYVVQMSYGQIIATNGCTVLAYFCLGVILRLKKGDSLETKLNIRDTRKLFKSLATLVIVNTLGLIITSIFRLIVPYVHMEPDQLRLVTFIIGLFSNSSLIVYTPVLILFSTVYRQAYMNLLPKRENNVSITAGVNVQRNKLVIPGH